MLATHVGREQTIEACGRVWRVSRWTRAVWAEWLAWARSVLPDPVEVALKHLDTIPPDLRDSWVRMALDRKLTFLSLGSPEVRTLLTSLEGTVRVLWILLKKYQPDATEDDAFDVAMELGQAELDALVKRVSGENQAGEAQAPAP